jgi:signal recognition particle receptor subunit beta
MGSTYKIVVTGPFSAGKTKFIKTISDIEVVSTERRITERDKRVKAQTTVAMDYGRVALGDDTLHLTGTPGQARFHFMWEILTHEMHGFVVLVDSADPASFGDARALIDLFTAAHAVPYVVAANKQDVHGAASLNRVRRALDLHPEVLLMPCVASRKTSVKQVLAQLAELI